MPGTAEDVKAAAEAFQTAQSQLRLAREQADLVREELRGKSMQKARRLWEDDDEQLHLAESDDTVQAVQRYLLGGDPGDLEPEVLSEFEDLRQKYLPRVEAAEAACRQVERTLEEPHADLVRELRTWYARARVEDEASLDEWATILRAWRAASDRTTREAAADLEVSPSAIVRYEKGTRTASHQNIAAMIDRIEAIAPIAPDTRLRELTRQLARNFYEDKDATELLETQDSQPRQQAEHEELQEEIGEKIAHLGLEQLRVVASIVRDSGAIDALLEWAGRSDPLQPVLDALRPAGQGASGADPGVAP